jgi:hypothetical protein
MINVEFNLKITDLFFVNGLVSIIHYISCLLSNYHSALTISGVTNSAEVGLIAAIGALVYSVYRFFWLKHNTISI